MFGFDDLAILVGTSIANLYGAHKAKQSAEKAAKTQTEAATKAAALEAKATAAALAFQREQWNAAQTRSAPYAQLGQGALVKLGAGMGIPVTPTSTAPRTATPPPSAGGFGANFMPTYQPQPRAGAPGPSTGAPGQNALAMSMQPPSQASTTSTYAGQTVRMRAPTGEMEDVPAADVELFKRAGAQVVQ